MVVKGADSIYRYPEVLHDIIEGPYTTNSIQMVVRAVAGQIGAIKRRIRKSE